MTGTLIATSLKCFKAEPNKGTVYTNFLPSPTM